jgi:tetratricopeptide (TPR) repeat protein/class 3 adenylate cyclase
MFLVGTPHRELVLLGPAVTTVTDTEGAAEAGQILVSAATARALAPQATRDRGDGALLLRWRRAPQPPDGSTPERDFDEASIRALLPEVLADVLALGSPDAEHRVATIAFIRFSGTDRMLAEQGHDAVAEAMHVTLSAVEEAFRSEGITLLAVDVDIDGGKFFAASGVPHASEDDEGSMVRALRSIVTQDLPLPLQAGVNRGHVFAAELGAPRRAAYSAMGDTTNTAARICSKAPIGRLYAHPAVLEHSRSLFDTEPAGPFTFKGKSVPLVVYDVGAEGGVRDVEDDDPAFMGRENELVRIREAVDALATGTGKVITITGATGMGKSRLMRQALRDAADVAILPVRAEPYGATSPYRMFRDRVRDLLGVERGDAQQMSDAVFAGVRSFDPALLPLAPLIAEVAHVEVPGTPEADAIDPRFRPDRTADMAITLLERGFDGRIVIIAEDAHWADEASAHLLGRLAEACRTRPWLLLVARRDVDEGFRPEVDETIDLEPLDDDVVRALVIAATEATPLRPHEIDTIVARSAGTPLFVEEITRAVREIGSLDAVPESLNAAMAAQIDALDPFARRVLSYASVLGRSFRRDVFDGVLTAEDLLVDDATRQRVNGFLEPDGDDRLRFRNGLVRDVAYDGLAYRMRKRLHREAGEVLEALSQDEASYAAALSMHFSQADDHERTWRYARLAAERAERAYANADAAAEYERALDAARRVVSISEDERLEVWTRLGDVRELAGMFDGALDAYRRASRSTDDPVRKAELLLKRARARERAGSFPGALRELTIARRMLESVDDDRAPMVRARAASFGAMVRFGQENYGDALRRARLAEVEARTSGAGAALAEALSAMEICPLYLGTPGDGAHLRQAVAIYHELGDLRKAARSENNLGNILFHAGHWQEALDRLLRSREDSLRLGDTVGAAETASNLGEIMVIQGRLDEAEPHLREAVRVMRSVGFVDGAAYAELQLARLLTARGDVDSAEALLERVAVEFEELGQLHSVLEAEVVQAECLVARQRHDEALVVLERAEHRAGGEAALLLPRISLVRASAMVQMGRTDEVASVLDIGLGAAREQGLPLEEALLVVFAAEHAAVSGFVIDAEETDRAEGVLAGLRSARPSART